MTSKSSLLMGKKALITGAGKGIGREIALALAKNGADVCVASRTKDDVDAVAAEINSSTGVQAYPFLADVSSTADSVRLVDQALARMGAVDVLVCAAGYPLKNEMWESKLHDLGEDDFLKVFQVDVLGSFRIIKSLLPSMIKQRNGVIILFSSTPAIAGYNKGAPYTVAKAANLGLVKDLASEYGEYNIRVYGIAPGNVRTERTFNQLTPEVQKMLADESSMKRWGEPQEIAEVAVVLASDKMSFVTGQTIVVDGGTVMY